MIMGMWPLGHGGTNPKTRGPPASMTLSNGRRDDRIPVIMS